MAAMLGEELGSQNLDNRQQEPEKRSTHLRAEAVEKRAKFWNFLGNCLGGVLAADFSRLRRLKNRLKPKQPFSGQLRGREDMDRVVEDIKRPVWQLCPPSAAWARLTIAFKDDVRRPALDRNHAGLKDQAAIWAEGRELDRQGGDSDTSAFVLYAAAVALGWIVGVVLGLWLL